MNPRNVLEIQDSLTFLRKIVYFLFVYAFILTCLVGFIMWNMSQKKQPSELQIDTIRANRVLVNGDVVAWNLLAEKKDEPKRTIISTDGILLIQDDKTKGIYISNGPRRYLAIYDSLGSERLVMGQAATTDVKQGGTNILPESSITGFGKDGMVLRSVEILNPGF